MGSDSDTKDRERHSEIAGHYRMLKDTARRPELPTNRLGQDPDAEGDAGPRVVQQFNRTLARLEELDAVPRGMFAPLPDDAGWASMCIAHEQLAAFIQPQGAGERVEEHEIETTTGAPGAFVLNFRPYIGAETDATEIGALARELVPKEMRAVWKTMDRVGDDEDRPGRSEEAFPLWKTVHKPDSDDDQRRQQVADFLLRDDPSGAEVSRRLDELRELATRRAQEAQDRANAESEPDD